MNTNPFSHQPRVHDTYNYLCKLVDEMGAEAKLPSVAELKKTLGASNDTLNTALRELERRRLIYVVRGSGIFVSPRQRILFLCRPYVFEDPGQADFWKLFLQSTEKYAYTHHKNFQRHFINPTHFDNGDVPASIRTALLEGQFDGVIGANLPYNVVRWLDSLPVPTVQFAAYSRCSVSLASGRLHDSIEELVNVRGCRRIAFWVTSQAAHEWDQSTSYYNKGELLSPLRTTLHLNGLEFDESLLRWADAIPLRNGEVLHLPYCEQGARLAERVFAGGNKKRPDAILFHNDNMARGALDAFSQMGITAGRDIQVATTCNLGSPVLAPYENDIIRVEFDTDQIAWAVFDLLETLMRGEMPVNTSITIHPTIRRK